ncbi:MAG: FAD-dependent oxidoreductase, partial [Lentisphaeria bacterium]|nr:FAD-dependent oxidoreductase [Lentisphaeria bacterium]
EYRNRNARECGVLEEMKLEAHYRNANGWEQQWSLVLREWAEREPNLTLLLNTLATDVTVEGNRITSVIARTLGSETVHRIIAPVYLDCSGDSFLGNAAGAEFRMGREARSEFGESLAPEKADGKTMGSSIAFRAIDLGHPVPFAAPPWAMKINGDEDLPYRIHTNPKQGYWWLEYGGELDTITDNEEIYRKLLAILFGVWDHVKNGGDHGAANYAINWISSIPGKRESRRLMGDHILTQNDVVDHPAFPDTVAYGGWPIDIHPPEGVFSKGPPGSTPPFIFPGTYPIPFRCLYSRNISNLMMAGRNISVTHVALGTTRVMATCALCGQAVAAAAVLMRKYGITPREVGRQHIRELQTLLAEDDSVLPMVPIPVKGLPAAVSASSEFTLKMTDGTSSEPLIAPEKTTDDPCDVPPADRRRVQRFIASENILETVRIRLEGNISDPIEAELLDDKEKTIASARSSAANGIAEFHFQAPTVPGRCYAVRLPQVPDVSVALHRRYLPGLDRKLDGCYLNNENWCFETIPPLRIYPAENAVNGLARPTESSPNLWISEPGMPQWLELDFNGKKCIGKVELIFDTNLDKPCYCGVPIECVRDYELQYLQKGQWRTLTGISGNHQRRRIHSFDPVKTEKLRLVVTATNGDPCARVYEFRAMEAGS